MVKAQNVCMEKSIVIIGNGISGITAARNIRKKSNVRITVISEESPFFFSRTALMYVYMGHMRFKDIQPYENNFWEKNRIDLIHERVEALHPENNSVRLQSGKEISYTDLVLATGSKPNIYSWPGVELKGIQGLYSKQDLESLEEWTPRIQSACIVGGGLIGIELAEMLLSRGIEVHFLVRESQFWSNVLPTEDANFVSKHIDKHHNLVMHYSSELEEILGDDQQCIRAIKTKNGETIHCQFLGLTIGVSPNIDIVQKTDIECDRGILVDHFLRTSRKNIWALGDCVQMRKPIGRRRNIEQVWYTGRMMGEALAGTLTGTPTPYEPGIWFNSAKFFDLEYQTYGWVFPQSGDNETSFIWQDEKRERMLHFVFDTNSLELIGINTFGIRLRHELMDNVFQKKQTIEYVLSHFTAFNFDPEFFIPFEDELIRNYNQQFNKNLQLQKKSWWQKLLQHA